MRQLDVFKDPGLDVFQAIGWNSLALYPNDGFADGVEIIDTIYCNDHSNLRLGIEYVQVIFPPFNYSWESVPGGIEFIPNYTFGVFGQRMPDLTVSVDALSWLLNMAQEGVMIW